MSKIKLNENNIISITNIIFLIKLFEQEYFSVFYIVVNSMKNHTNNNLMCGAS